MSIATATAVTNLDGSTNHALSAVSEVVGPCKKRKRGRRNYHYKQVVRYTADLDLRNTMHLPPRQGARYLFCTRCKEGNGRLVARYWCRGIPVSMGWGEVLVDFFLVPDDAMHNITPINEECSNDRS